MIQHALNRWTLVFSIALVGFVSGVGLPNELQAQLESPKQSSVSFAEYQANMDETYRQFDRMLASLDSARFDLDPALDDLDFDSELIVEFVTKEISFQQYPGVLRGARGTLMSRAGNALDQSLLLATLLRNAGYDARIAEGHLSEEQVLELFKVIAVPEQPGFSAGEISELSEAAGALKGARENQGLVKDFVGGLRDSRPRKDLEPYARLSEENAAAIKSILKSGFSLELQSIPDQILEEARQYFWVELKEGTSEAWRPLHPVFSEVPESIASVSAKQYLAESIPEEYQQRVTITVEIEQAIGGKLKTHTVMPPWSRPTASLYGMELAFYNIPMNFTGSDSPMSQLEALESAEFFMPVMDGVSAQSMQVFDLNGNMAPSDAVLNPASGVFRQVGESMGKASAALNAATARDGSTMADFVPKLVSQTVKIELNAPGQEPRIFKKAMIADDLETFDESGEPTMALKDALSAQLTIAFAMGDFPDQYLLSQTITRLKNSRPMLDAVHAQILDTDEDELWDKSRFAKVPTSWGRMSTLISLMNKGDLPTNHVAYFAEPGLIIHRFSRDRRRDLEGSLDIMSNKRRVFDTSGPVPMVDPESQLVLGAWDTAIEEAFYQRPLQQVLPTAGSEGSVGFERVTATNELSPVIGTRKSDVARWMQRDLDAGFTLLVPKGEPGASSGSIAWWRVNVETGETLGMLADGTGGASAVYPVSVQIPEWLAKFMVSAAVSGAFAYAGYVDCVGATQEEQCCAEVAVGGTIAGGLIGFGVGMTVLWEFTVFQLFWVEVGINGAIGLYTGMDMFSELCTTTIFGRNEEPLGILVDPKYLLAYRAPECAGL